MASDVTQTGQTTQHILDEVLPSPNVLAGVVRVALPPIAVSGGMVVVFNFLRRLVGASATLRVARFVDLLLASLLVGSGIGAMVAIHPALRALPAREFFESERAIAPRHGSLVRMLMPAAVVSCVNVLRLLRNRRSPAFGLTVAGMANLAGAMVVAGIELPLKMQTMETRPDEVSDWVSSRERWDQFNSIRNALTLHGWALLCLAALSET